MMHFYFLILVAMTGIQQQQLPYRQLLIFEGVKHSSLVAKQINVLKEAPEAVEDRDLKPVIIKEKNALYKKYHVKPDEFAVILIGKDGTEKYRSVKVIPLTELFAIIDAMPMRRAEVKNKR